MNEEGRKLHLYTAAGCCSCHVKFVVEGGELTRDSITSQRSIAAFPFEILHLLSDCGLCFRATDLERSL
jgi:CxxC motif-containing protein (DUF1111 family)